MEDFVCDKCSKESDVLYCYGIYKHGFSVEWSCKDCKPGVESDFFEMPEHDKEVCNG